jgi:hypothetical protein
MPTISTLTVDVESKTSGLSKGLKIATAGLAALAAGAAYAFGQFEESEKVAAQTDAVLKSTGNSAHTTAAKISDLANALAAKTGIDDEAIQTGQNMILTFKNISNQAGKGNDIFDRTTKAVLDMSVAMGTDMKSSAIQVGKALNDPIAGISALSRVGVTFSEAQKKQIEGMVKHNDLLGAQKLILGELTSEFGGSAAAQATASGKMSVALGNLAEKIGGLLAPAITAILSKVTEWAQVLTDSLGPALTAIGDWVKDHEGLVKTLAIAVGAVAGAMLVWTAATKIAAAAQLILNLVMAANPFGLIALAVIATAAVIIAKWGAVKRFLLDAWDAIQDAAKFVWDHVAIFVLGPMKLVIDWLIDHWRGVGTVMKAVWDATVGNIIDGVKEIIGWVHTLISAVEAAIGWISKLGSNMSAPLTASGAPAIVPHGMPPGAVGQEGGDVLRTGLAFIHKGETLIPDGGGMASVTVNIGTLYGGSPAEIARVLRDELLKLKARNGSTGL